MCRFLLSLSSLLAVSATLHIFHDTRPGCSVDAPVTVHYTVRGGTPPYFIDRVLSACVNAPENTTLIAPHTAAAHCPWSSSLVLKDSKGDSGSLSVEEQVRGHKFMSCMVSYAQTGDVLKFTADIKGGTPPYQIEWGSGGKNNVTTFGPALMGMWISVIDSGMCRLKYWPYLGTDDIWCPKLDECRHLPYPFIVSCYKRLCWDAMTEKTEWHHCSSRAAFAMIMAMKTKEYGVVDHGAAFFALRLLRGSRTHWALVRQLLEYDSNLGLLFDLYERGHLRYKELMRIATVHMLGLKAKRVPKIDTLIVSPAGFYNEPIFAPQLAHGRRRVATLTTAEGRFPSSYVRCLVTPLSMEVDVDLAAAFLRQVVEVLQPEHLFPGDSAGILTIAKAIGPVYPPPMLGKLPRGHEAFAPDERVLTEDDGISVINVDIEKAKLALESLGGHAYLKREFSDAARGVMGVTAQNLESAIRTVLPRGVGIDGMDFKLPVRLFLQKKVNLGIDPKILGFRFFARNGTVLAGYTSKLLAHETEHALEYITVRDEVIERSSIAYIDARGYSGFGSAWWFFDVEHGPYLLDFNARLERHACIGAILQGAEKLLCPCMYFALDLTTPFEPVPAGRRYTDPIRMSRSSKHYTPALWNVRREDEKLMSWIEHRHKRVPPSEEDEEIFLFE